MATLISTTNVGLSELETAPGGSNPPSNLRFEISGRKGWAEGVLGANTYAFYTWGYGYGSGGGYLDAIYGLAAPTSGTNPPLEIGDWRGLQYYFDGSPFDITYRYTNSLTNTPDDDCQVDVVITDSSVNYSIFGGPNTPPNFAFNVNMPANTSAGAVQIPGFQPDTYPLVKNVFWLIQINTGPFFNGGTFTMDVNGSNVFTIAVNAGPNNVQYDWNSGTYGSTSASGIALNLEMN